MKILIAVDMEGISGVVDWDQVSPGTAEYPRFQRIMTGDVNAAILGAFEGGAREVVVTDGHNNGRNILIEELDERARLNQGNSSPYSMVQGIDGGIDGVIFIGYHARIGTPQAILEHTWSSTRVANLTLNGKLYGEIGLNAAVCGHFDTPILMISGDQSACAEAKELIPSIETVVVKQASARMAAECLPFATSQSKIRKIANAVATKLAEGEVPSVFRLQTPITVNVEFTQSEMADNAMVMPKARRVNGKQVEYIAEDIPMAYLAFRCLVGLAK